MAEEYIFVVAAIILKWYNNHSKEQSQSLAGARRLDCNELTFFRSFVKSMMFSEERGLATMRRICVHTEVHTSINVNSQYYYFTFKVMLLNIGREKVMS